MNEANETKQPSPRAPETEGVPVTPESLFPPDAIRPQNSFNTLLGELPPQPGIV